MTKPRIFISHVVADSELASALKGFLTDAFSGAIDLFVSSDVASIPAGTAWFTQIIEALRSADAVICVVTPNSAQSPWVHFEAGGGHLMRKPTIPILAGDIDFDRLKPPLSMLQARNLNDLEGCGKFGADVSSVANLSTVNFDRAKLFQHVTRALKQATKKEATAKAEATLSGEDLPNDRQIFARMRQDTAFFSTRFAAAFPGIRAPTQFENAREAVERLAILLQKPLGASEGNSIFHPIWWFRGHANLQIEWFEVLGPTKVLLNVEELEIRRIVAVHQPAYYRQFVYVEAGPMPPTGLYPAAKDDIEAQVNRMGYADEEYGIFEGKYIKRTEYDDNAAVIDNRVVSLEGKALLRVRYLSPYNLIIAPHGSPLNNSDFDEECEQLLDSLLRGGASLDRLIELSKRLPRRDRHG